jgi:hypothetical protein|tara:strand:- start:13912 stop:14187 length:276 start_codon:yes stop_codon:yes gene_type:complete
MSWFDIIKNEDNYELVVYEQLLKIKGMMERAREDLYENIEPAVKGMIDAGLDEKYARQTAKVMISPMLRDLEKREKEIDEQIKEVLDMQKR